MKILLKSFHLKHNGQYFRPGDEVDVDKKTYGALAKKRAGAFDVITAEESSKTQPDADLPLEPKKKKTGRAKK